MSYCRFSTADVYLFEHVDGYICCQVCSLTPKTCKTVFTTGISDEEDSIFGMKVDPCRICGGEGCDSCCMCHDTNMNTYEEAIVHVREHIAAGDRVPEYVIQRLEKDARMEKYASNTRYRREAAKRDYLKKIAFGKTKSRKAQNLGDHEGAYVLRLKTKLRATRLGLERIRSCISDIRNGGDQ